jgi:hypothetical protein
MKSIKKITVFYTDGTFEDIEKTQTFDISKINTAPVVNTNPWWNNNPTSYTYTASSPAAGLNIAPVASLTTAQISTISGGSLYDGWKPQA